MKERLLLLQLVAARKPMENEWGGTIAWGLGIQKRWASAMLCSSMMCCDLSEAARIPSISQTSGKRFPEAWKGKRFGPRAAEHLSLPTFRVVNSAEGRVLGEHAFRNFETFALPKGPRTRTKNCLWLLIYEWPIAWVPFWAAVAGKEASSLSRHCPSGPMDPWLT